jgi:hypothetical protein
MRVLQLGMIALAVATLRDFCHVSGPIKLSVSYDEFDIDAGLAYSGLGPGAGDARPAACAGRGARDRGWGSPAIGLHAQAVANKAQGDQAALPAVE